jgi:hypothetical protein
MRNLVIPRGRPSSGALLLALALALAPAFAGCGRAAPGHLKVATTWPAFERRRLESEFQRWVAAAHGNLEHRAVELEWLTLEPGDDLVRLVERRGPPDVLLGGSLSSFARLVRMDRLAPIDQNSSALVFFEGRASSHRPGGSARPIPSDSSAEGAEWRGQTAPGPEPGAALAAPRDNRISLARSLCELDHGRWRSGYARLVQAAGADPGIGAASSRAASESGRNHDDRAGARRDPPFRPSPFECAAIRRAAGDPVLARGFVRFLAEALPVAPARTAAELMAGIDPEVESVVADLLGATLFDAQDELWAAWAALDRAGRPPPALAWLTEPPPWPPASVATYQRRDAETAMALMQTLAQELVPDPAPRAWLTRSWLSPPRTVDDKLLGELAHAENGRLAREPRFRGWLREEWTAWARQRYRRVARRVASEAWSVESADWGIGRTAGTAARK